ncbi:MAG: ribonuclease H-like domain-containing protein [Nitrososphaerota archaeon]|nr:ribonuclease H-like domain-containing protein [Candidatus Calditenuis fumarioli]
MRPKPDVIALDIETTSLHADTGHLVCAVIGDFWTGRLRSFLVRRPEQERQVVEALLKRIGRSHVLFTWRGSSFDVPWLVTRCIKLRVDPSPIYAPRHVDLATVVEKELRLSNTSLWNVVRFLGLRRVEETLGADVPMLYERALLGKGRELSRILRHCKEDVELTIGVARALRPVLTQLFRDLPPLS